MPKLKKDAIEVTDFVDYLDSYSDFSFELSTLKMLRKNNIQCEHGGLYEDPVTGKSREFDIRASKTISKYRIRLAIECKNIRDNFPILISCVPRHEDESYHQIALVSESKSTGVGALASIHQSRAKTVSIRGDHSIYRPKGLVGKSTVQVGRTLDGSLSANDSELYDKWSQCLSSAADLISRTYWDGNEDDELDFYLSAVIPIVVVPNERLWSVEYDDNGNRVSQPKKVNRCSCFIDKDYEMGSKIAWTRMWLSHVEIMTIDGLTTFVNTNLKSEDGISLLFSKDGILKAFDNESEGK